MYGMGMKTMYLLSSNCSLQYLTYVLCLTEIFDGSTKLTNLSKSIYFLADHATRELSKIWLIILFYIFKITLANKKSLVFS